MRARTLAGRRLVAWAKKWSATGTLPPDHVIEWSVRDIEAEAGVLDAAWAAVENAKPEGMMGPSVAQDYRGRWNAYVYRHHEDAPMNPAITDYVDTKDHDTATAALLALAAKMGGPQR